jgi:hypothetical protein
MGVLAISSIMKMMKISSGVMAILMKILAASWKNYEMGIAKQYVIIEEEGKSKRNWYVVKYRNHIYSSLATR